MRRILVLVWTIAFVHSAGAQEARGRINGEIVDADSRRRVAARLYLRGPDGSFHFVRSLAPDGSAVVYDKTNWLNPKSVEKHTTLSAHPFTAEVPPGKYTIIVERGKEYFPESREIMVGATPVSVRILLRRWFNAAERGWYSGETHIHRTLQELPNVMLAEDLNVAFPLTYWVTKAFTPPTAGDRNIGGAIPEKLIEVDATHVIWPRNTEYEIFTIGPKRHTLGALFILGHRSVFARGFPPVGPVADQARAEGALLDMDKLDWPFALTLPHSSGATLYELSNNHLWRTEFAFRDWNSATPGYLQPPRGGKSGTEREWLHYTLGLYYTLLNAGFPLVPCAGTANGVHPVPAGFGRVYVHLPAGFTYETWQKGLRDGRSFVTTGPMLLGQINETLPGSTLKPGPRPLRVKGTVTSEYPLAFIEVVVNGEAVRTVMPQNKAMPSGAHESAFDVEVTPSASGWICIRCFEDRPDGRVRFAHTAPWRIEIPGKPLLLRREEKEYLIRRVQDEITRSGDILPAEPLGEYRAALARFEKLGTHPDDRASARSVAGADRRRWLENMVWHHRFSNQEIGAVLGLSDQAVSDLLKSENLEASGRPKRKANDPVLVLPYPGGRHPRTGFLDGALRPQRETKVSAFLPWDPDSYAVIDVPEAIWSNLGLTYLAHTHVPTIWDAKKVQLPPMEWTERDGAFELQRRLPNGIVVGGRVVPERGQVRMELSLTNGTTEMLSQLRAQVCVMLKGAAGFHAQTRSNKRTWGAVVACQDETGKRWIMTAWEPLHRAWNNPPVPCLHADPAFSNCEPGKTVRARGVVRFYEGTDPEGEAQRLSESLR